MELNLTLLYNAAKKMQLPIHYIPELDYLDIPLGKTHYYFFSSLTPLNLAASIYIFKNKFNTQRLLADAGFPVPKAIKVHENDFSPATLAQIIKTLNFPLVAKPAENSSRGLDVLCNIKSLSVLEAHMLHIFKKHHEVEIEEFHEGLKEYRVLVFKNQVIGVVERYSASVIGDGIHTIEELIAIKNQERERLSRMMTTSPLTFDLEYQQCIEEQGLSLNSIIPRNKKIKLCHTVNTGRGGDAISIGKKIHPQNTHYLCQALRETGLFYAGFDLLCEDIQLPFSQTKWLIIEINHNPDLTLHDSPNQGIKMNVSHKIIRQLILKHPLSYVHHLCFKSPWSLWIKAIMSILGLLLLLYATT